MKNKRLNNKGFVLVETLIVAVAVSAIFAMVFKHFYPLIGEYERREDYDDIDSKYGAYWIKRMIQDPDYKISAHANSMNSTYHFYFFNCKGFDMNGLAGSSTERARLTEKRNMCYKIIENLEVSCDVLGDSDEDKNYIENCSNHNLQPHIYITDYNLEQFKNSLANYSRTSASIGSNQADYYNLSPAGNKTVTSGLEEYVRYLPKYKFASLNGANKRVIIEYYRHRFDTPYKPVGSGFDTTKYVAGDSDDFLSYSTMEVKKK
ncbi:MAG: hypothetical protein IJ193_08995 [Bacilli bacterium]|nr:hypothetical protein [Bacilli bacterium]